MPDKTTKNKPQDSQDTTVYLKNYQVPAFAVDAVDLNFDLYEEHTLVTSTLRLSRLHKGPLHLFGSENNK